MTPQLSYLCGTSDRPLTSDTIGAAFDRTADSFGENIALVVSHQKVAWTWEMLREQVDAFAQGLISLDLTPGDRIGIWAPNCWEWVVTQFATAKAGLILVNINPGYRIAELEFSLKKVGCRALILADRYKSSDYIGMIAALIGELTAADDRNVHCESLPDLHILIGIGENFGPEIFRFEDVCSRGNAGTALALERLQAELQPEDPINIQFTSGTTGLPKGATLTHHNILNNAFFAGECQGIAVSDKVCIPVPLYHCFGMVLGTLACVAHGATMVLPAPTFDPLATLECIEAEKCTALYGVPTMFIAILNHENFKNYDVSSLRTGIMAGSPCPVEVMKRVVSSLNMDEVTIGYGMTETSPISFQSSRTDPIDKRVSTVGRIQPHVEAKVIDEKGRILPRGFQGELCTRGYLVMHGYWNEPAKTSEAIDAAGWMHTGDLATIDEEGYCNITGRVKDMVIRGGENLFPREIEDFLYRHPAIQDVQVFGVPDDRYGEELCAWILLRPGDSICEEDVRSFCNGQIAHYKIPRYIRFVQSFPMTVTGKIQKVEMRKVMIEELSLAEEETA